jgi:2-polyprenyl-6-methoxyphenol hydroxylase-like FAD-dependent oxidoreductase
MFSSILEGLEHARSRPGGAVQGGQVWFATVAQDKAGAGQASQAAAKQFLLSRFGGWHDPVASLIDQTPPEAIIWDDAYGHTVFEGFSTERATLIGDAAHGVR